MISLRSYPSVDAGDEARCLAGSPSAQLNMSDIQPAGMEILRRLTDLDPSYLLLRKSGAKNQIKRLALQNDGRDGS